MKKFILGLMLGLCITVYAAVDMTITVPDAAVTPVLEAMEMLAGTHMTLEARGHGNPEEEFDGRWDFTIAEKAAGETQKQFAERFTKELLRASVRLVRQAEEDARYRAEIAEIEPPDVNIPDGVIQ